MIRFDRPVELAASLDDDTRTISGIAVPWNVDAAVSSGQLVRFLPGSLPVDGEPPKFLAGHDMNRPLGRVVERAETSDGMTFTAKVSRTQAGDEALVLAADGVLDAVSVGVDPIDYTFEGRTMVVARGRWIELSLVPVGAFEGARVATVAAEAPEHEADEADPTNNGDEVAEETTMNENENVLPEPVLAAAPVAVRVSPRPVQVSAAEWISARIVGGEKWAAIQAANQDTDDSTGILPEPIIGPVYDGISAIRPVIDALGTRAIPGSGRTFTRPKITQRTSVAEQAGENVALASQAMIVSPQTVTIDTYGGYVTLSEQDVDFTDPSALALVIDDLARQYALATETAACDAVLNTVGTNTPVADWTDPQDVLDAVWTARTNIAATGYLPTHLLCSPDRVADLGKLSVNGQPLFPNLGPSNALGDVSVPQRGGLAFGLIVVESAQLGDEHMIVCNPRGLELYERQKGAIQVSNPSTLGVTVAWRGYFATLSMDTVMFQGVGNV